MKLRVGVDARKLKGNITGIGMFTKKLIDNLLTLPDIDVFLFTNDKRAADNLRQMYPEAVVHDLPRGIIKWWIHALPRGVTRLGLHLFIEPNFLIGPKKLGSRTAIVIHDLAPLKVGWDHPIKHRLVMLSWLPFSVKLSDYVCTVSYTMKNELRDDLNIDGVFVLHNELEQQITLQSNLNKDLVLYVGTLIKRKNVPALIKGFKEATENLQEHIKLVVAGELANDEKNIRHTIDSLSLTQRVQMLGYVSNEERENLFERALCLCYLSKYEGFGIPLLEGLAKGVPVVASDIPVHREVLGELGLYVDPTDQSQVASQILKACSDETWRMNVREKGPSHVLNFKMREGLVQLLNQVRSDFSV